MSLIWFSPDCILQIVLILLVSAFTLVRLNQLPSEQVEEDTLGFDWGKGPKSYPEKRPVCHRFSTNTLTDWPEAAGCQNRHLDFHQSLFSRVATLIPLGGCQTNLPWVALPETEVPNGIALALPIVTALLHWGGVGP